jgi:hypothetical protein
LYYIIPALECLKYLAAIKVLWCSPLDGVSTVGCRQIFPSTDEAVAKLAVAKKMGRGNPCLVLGAGDAKTPMNVI